MWRQRVLEILTWGLFLGAAAFGIATVRTLRRAVQPETMPRMVGQIPEAVALLAPRDPVLLNGRTLVTVFTDFQCPACRLLHSTIIHVRRTSADSLLVVYRHFPLQRSHPHAFEAAIAAECAREQHRFWEFSDALFRNQDAIGVSAWSAFAEDATIADPVGFGACLASSGVAELVQNDIELGLRLGVGGTPSFIVGGKLFLGSVSPEGLAKIVQQYGGREPS